MDSGWICNSDEIAELLGITKRQVYRLKDQGLPISGKGKYHAPSVLRWFIDERSGSNAADITEQRKQLYKAQTDKTELDNAQTRSELLRADAVQTTLLEVGTIVRTQIEAFEPRFARKMLSEAVPEFRADLKALLDTIASEINTRADIRDDSRDHPTTT